MVVNSAMRFVDLPFDLVQRICRRLNPVDVCELALTCRALRFVSQTDEAFYGMARAHLVQNGEGSLEDLDLSVHEGESGIEYYKRLHRQSRIQYADELSVTWADDARYYEWVDSRDSVTPHALRLRTVCWLDGSAVFPHVQPGYYRPIWRVQLSERMYMLSNSVMQAGPVHINMADYGTELKNKNPPSTQPTRTVRRLVTKKDLEDIPTETWVNFELPVLWVEDASAVNMRLMNHSTHWKSGMLWDCARLVRVKADGTPYCCAEHDHTHVSTAHPDKSKDISNSASSSSRSTQLSDIEPEMLTNLEHVQQVMQRLWGYAGMGRRGNTQNNH